jgi:hypothetical protein
VVFLSEFEPGDTRRGEGKGRGRERKRGKKREKNNFYTPK